MHPFIFLSLISFNAFWDYAEKGVCGKSVSTTLYSCSSTIFQLYFSPITHPYGSICLSSLTCVFSPVVNDVKEGERNRDHDNHVGVNMPLQASLQQQGW